VRVGVDFPDKDEEPDFEQLQQIHRNAQACSVLLSSLEKMSLIESMVLRRPTTFGTLLKEPMKAPSPWRKPRGNSLKSNLIDLSCLMLKTPQEMYNQLKKLVNKVKVYDSKRWGDRRVIDRMLWAYAVKDTTVIFLIQQDPTFKRMTLNEVLGKIINHEMLVEEAQYVKNLSKGIISSKKQDIAFKAIKKSKKVLEESWSEEEVDDSDDESTGYDPKRWLYL
jgi:hypothetical protein